MRTYSTLLAAAALTAACAPESGEPEGVAIECAIGAGAQMTPDCLLEPSADGTFTIHRPDDTFQRFRYDPTRFRVTPLDGADTISDVRLNTPAGSGLLEFSHGNDRYRLDPSGISDFDDE
jgi:hypothetical protein